MVIEGLKIREVIINRQFEIINSPVRIGDIPEDGMVLVNKKKVWWHNVYRFTEEQEKKWRKWAWELCKKNFSNPEKEMRYIELRWGFALVLKKEGELF